MIYLTWEVVLEVLCKEGFFLKVKFIVYILEKIYILKGDSMKDCLFLFEF